MRIGGYVSRAAASRKHGGHIFDILETPLEGSRKSSYYIIVTCYICKTVWDSGALVAWSSDNITFMDFMTWNPYLGMEVGMTRKITEKTRNYEFARCATVFPPEDERMNIEEMLLGFTINGAKQLGVEDIKGSITAGKDADYLVFDQDLLTAEKDDFSNNKPTDVYFAGKKVN